MSKAVCFWPLEIIGCPGGQQNVIKFNSVDQECVSVNSTMGGQKENDE